MLGYTVIEAKVNEDIKPYIKTAEVCKISGLIEFNGKTYREVILYKKSFLKFNKDIKGYLYIDNENKAVTDKYIISELSKLCFFYEMFFSEAKSTGILATLKTETDLQRDKNKINQISEGLDFLFSQKIYAADRVKGVFIKYSNLEEKSNAILKELSNNIKTIRAQDLIFNIELFNKLYPYYEDVLKINFEKVLNAASIGDCIEEVRREAEKVRKKWGVRTMGNMVGKLIKTSDELSYYKRLISLYSSVLQMNSNQYIKYLNNLNKNKIEKRVNLIRG